MENIVAVTCPECGAEFTFPEHGRTQYVLCPECLCVAHRRKPEPLTPVLPAYVYCADRRLTEIYKTEKNLKISWGAEIIVLGEGSNIRKPLDSDGKQLSDIMEEACSVSAEYLRNEEK